MYRLCRLNCFHLCKIQSISTRINVENQFRKCSHCNHIVVWTPQRSAAATYETSYARGAHRQRFYSTKASSAALVNTQVPRKKQARKKKNYTELLEVTTASSHEKRAQVSKLNAKSLAMLIEDPLPDNPATDAQVSYLLENIPEEALVQAEHELLEGVEETTFTQYAGEKRRKNVYFVKQNALLAEQHQMEQEGKSESLAESLAAYLDLCVSCGYLHRGLTTLLAYRKRCKTLKNLLPISNIKPFNVMLSGFATKGHLTKVCEIYDYIKEDGIQPTIATFNSCFECVGRIFISEKSNRVLNEWHTDMQHKGLSLNSLFQDGEFLSADQYGFVLRACKRIQPLFKPHIEPHDKNYSCSLLEELNTIPPQGVNQQRCQGLLTAQELQKLAAEQLNLELKGSLSVSSVEKSSQPPTTTAFYREILGKAQVKWRENVTEAFRRNLESLRAQQQGFKGMKEMTLYPFLKVLPSEQYIDIIMHEIRKLAEGSETFSPSLQLLYRDVGARVLTRYQVQSKLVSGVVYNTEQIYQKYCEWFTSDCTEFPNMREKWQHLLNNHLNGTNLNCERKTWPNHLQISLGKFLYTIILRDVKIDVNMLRPGSKKCHVLPAFYSLYRSQGKVVKEEIKPHPIMARLYRGAAQEELTFDAEKVPMLCPPIPWSSVLKGGHIIANTDIVRLPSQAVQQWHRLLDAPRTQLYPVFDALNQLGSVPWKINQTMLNIVTEVFSSGGSSELDIPQPPSACPPPDQITTDMSKTERFQAHKNRLALRRKKAEMYSLWCDTLYRLSLANHFRNKIFWLPHNMDFRGRVYPCPPHLNHMGSDMARSILCFAKGEPLGKDGLRWLKIHVVNLTGLKKRDAIAERVKYAEEIMPDILDSADNPLTGGRWWVKSDEPWQTLACCMEIARASRSPDPESYICHFPIHQDGSCNGLQHYAALGRDEAGAYSVNLAPADTPQDVYSAVATLVEKLRVVDAENGVKVAQVLDGFVQRKVIKQTVMTTVYGVTKFGARLQIARQLKDIDLFPKDFVWQASTYLVSKTFESLREMFTSTKEIQDWFTECAKYISQVRGQNVEWVTPLGLPIVQPYSRTKRCDTATLNYGRRLHEYYNMDMYERPNVMKQKNAFPPNFIHSLDSSHMMLTSLFSQRKGITFVSVHDCYWTHPSTVDIMNKICREQFVALHKQPILEDLCESLTGRYTFTDINRSGKITSTVAARIKMNEILTQVPPKGCFDLSQVSKSIYFFS